MTFENDSLTVLFLEDSKPDIEIVYEKLKDDFDCPVFLDSAKTKDKFLQCITNKKYDVILADYTLPEFNAEEALKLAVSVCPNIPFICVSGTIGEDIAVELLQQGSADYVLKDRLGRLSFAICRAINRITDALKRKAQEIYIKKLNERSRLILESIDDGYGLYDYDGTILDISKSFAARFGKTVLECIGTKMEDYLPEDVYGDLAKSRIELLKKVFDTGKPVIFEDSRDGLWFNNRYYPVISGSEVIAVTLFSSDITGRKKAEEETLKNNALEIEATILRNKEKEYLEILDGSTEASWIYDFSAKTLKYSREWKQRIGGEEISDEDMNLYAMSLIHPDDLERVIQEKECTYKYKLTKYRCEYRFKIASGEYIWVYDQGKIIYGENEAPLNIYGTSMDISDRKKTEEALRKSEERFRAVQENSIDRFTILKPFYNDIHKIVDFTFVYQNAQAAKTAGCRPEELVGLRMTEVWPTFPKTRFFSMYKKAVETGKVIKFEEHYFADGLDDWFHAIVTPIPDGIAIATQVITDQKKAEKEREHLLSLVVNERERLKSIIGSIEDEVWISDATGNMVQMNPAAQRAHGLQADGESITDTVDKLEILEPDGTPRPLENTPVLRSLKGEVVSGEEIIRHTETGEKRYRWFTTSPIRDSFGNITGTVSVSRDITERKRAEEALRESEDRFHTAVMNPNIVLAQFDCDLRYIWIHNPHPDFNASQVVNKSDIDLDDSEAAHLLYALKREVVKSGKAIREEITFLRNDGAHTYDMIIEPVFDSTEAVTGGTSCSLDISSRKLVEEALRESEKKANELVVELKATDKNKNEFLNALSHELRNPLAVISAGLQIMDATQEPNQTTMAKEIMSRQMNQLCRLVDDLLDLTRISNNKIELKKESIELSKLAQLTAEDHLALFREKGVKLLTRISPQTIQLDADYVRLKQIIGNLLDNAKKYTNTGGEVILSVYKDKGEAIISIKDNGIGISAEIKPRLFQPFVQADMSIDRGCGGLGLGLSITKGIVELHGGAVKAFSEGLGKGSEFIIRLPLSDMRSDHKPYDSKIKPLTSAVKILIIEDNKDFTDLLSTMLTMKGYQVENSHNGHEGLDKARKFRPDIIFCDIGLPGKNGFEIAAAIKEDDTLKQIYLIALTGYAGNADLRRAKDSGFDRHLAKPVSLDSLQQVINEIIIEGDD